MAASYLIKQDSRFMVVVDFKDLKSNSRLCETPLIAQPLSGSSDFEKYVMYCMDKKILLL